MTPQPQAKPRMQTQKGTKNMQQYLQELDALLKRNSGTGLFSAEDTSSNTPMYIPGKVNNPGGVESNASAISAMSQDSVIPEFQMPEYPQEDPQGQVLGAETGNMSVGDFIDQFTQAVYSPQRSTLDQDAERYKQTGQRYGVQSLRDGRTRYNDGSIGIQEDPTAIASMQDGSVLWNDNFTREAPPREMLGQMSGTDGLSQFIFGRNQKITQPYGNINPVEPTAGNVNVGTDFRTSNLEQRELKLPVNTTVLQILRDDGTRFGDYSKHQGYGNSVLLELPTGERIRLSHLNNLPDFQEGQQITAGSVIGVPGTTGNTYGEHLDVEYYNQDGQISDPRQFLSNGAANFSQNARITGVSPYLQSNNMSVDPSKMRTSQTETQPQQSQGTQQFSSYNDTNYNMQRPGSSAASGAGYNPGQALQKFGQDVKQLPQKTAQAIDAANPTGQFDLGLTEGTITPQAAQTRMDTAVKFAQPSENRGFMGKFRQSVGNAAEQAGNMAGIPETGISEILAGGKTRQTNQAFASELDQAAQQNEPVGQSFNLKQGIQDAAQQAGQGIKSLGQAGVSSLGSIFQPKQEAPKRAVGDVSGTAEPTDRNQFSSLMDGAPSMSQMTKSDVSDPFFKMGGSEMYKNFLKPNAKDLYGGALSLDMFTPDFYKDLNNVSNVFGGSKDLGSATDRYIDNEKQKYPSMSRMDYKDGYDRGEVDNYNRQVDQYNNSINSYLNQIRSSVSGAKSVFTPVQSSKQNIFSKPQMAQGMSSNMSMAPNISKPQMSMAPNISKPQMSMARPSASPQMSSVNRAPQMSVAPKATPANANMSTNSGAVRASLPKATAPAPKPISTPSNANMSTANGAVKASLPAPQNQPKTNVFSKVTNAIKSVFRR